LLAYNGLEVALLSAFGRTPGMTLFGLRLTRADGAPIGTTRAFVRVFGRDHLIRLIMTLLHSTAPKMRGSAALAPVITSAAAALADSEHRTVCDRVAGTRMVRA
jgi:uncharacterized RDD family membrane protein YckC